MTKKLEDTFSIDKTFRIYKLDNVIRVDEVTQSYVLRICDPRMFYARRKKSVKHSEDDTTKYYKMH